MSPFASVVTSFGALALVCALGGCTVQQDLGNKAPPPAGSHASGGQSTDKGPPVLYATFNSDASPNQFAYPSSISYRGGYTVITGTAYEHSDDELTLRVPSSVGTFSCAVDGNTVVQLEGGLNGNRSTNNDPSSTCSIELTRFDPAGGRIVGTFSASLSGTRLSGGVIDLPRGPDQ